MPWRRLIRHRVNADQQRSDAAHAARACQDPVRETQMAAIGGPRTFESEQHEPERDHDASPRDERREGNPPEGVPVDQ